MLHEQIASGHAQYWLSILKSFDIEPCWKLRYTVSDPRSTNIHNSDSDTEDEQDKDIEIDSNIYDDFVFDL